METIKNTYNNEDIFGIGKDNVQAFLEFMKNDTSGAINRDWTQFMLAFRSFLGKKTFALEYYKQFISTNAGNFPNFQMLVEYIDKAEFCGKSFVDKVQMFYTDIWMHMHH